MRHQLSITAGQIDSKIAEARNRAQRNLARFSEPMSRGEAEEAVDEIRRAYRDQCAWETVSAAYAKVVA